MRKAKIDPRSAKKKAKDAAYAALPIVLILKPLKFINDSTGYYFTNKDGEKEWVASDLFVRARRHADRGNGAAVRRSAFFAAAGA